MAYQFITTARSKYFARNGDIVFHNIEHFIIKIKPVIFEDLNIEKFLIGFVINKKVGNAVIRNKIKRKLRVIFNNLPNISYKYCYILVARPSIKDLSFENLSQEISKSIAILLKSYRFVSHVKSHKNIKPLTK